MGPGGGRGWLLKGHPIRLGAGVGNGASGGVRSAGWWVRVLGLVLGRALGLVGLAVSLGSGGAGGSAAAGAVGLLAAGVGAVDGEAAGAG